ncbi:MAG: dimethylarginine dimethylaminohydrolase family protein [Planctomycetota bacterium]|jgi:N-dimethylarginine dimethylaminohydrolase
MRLGFQSDVGPLDAVIAKHPREAFVDQQSIDRQWRKLNYLGRPHYSRAVDESDRFLALLAEAGADVHLLGADTAVGLDSIYPRDAAVMCDQGAILCNMDKAARAAEPEALGRAFEGLGVPIHGRITGDGRLEGGDVAWLDSRTVAVGRGYRTNDDGIRQLGELLGGSVDELVVVPLPHWKGPDDVFHLMSMYSPLASDLALVYSALLPVPFRQMLLGRGTRLVEVPDEEFGSMGCNALALAPGVCLMLEGNPETRRRLEAAGVEVREFEGAEISRKGAGGPTCLTRPLRRQTS